MNKINYQKPLTRIHSVDYGHVMASSDVTIKTTETTVDKRSTGFTLGAKIWKNFDEE